MYFGAVYLLGMLNPDDNPFHNCDCQRS